MEKICVFCGKYPSSKTLEHVIPQWLIKHTGKSDREIVAGVNWTTGKPLKFPFNQLKFPACQNCNEKFSSLEELAKTVLIDLLAEKPLSNLNLEILLIWFDKVRIGLWLGQRYLTGNIFNVDPNYYIQHKINHSDRMLFIYRVNPDPWKGIRFNGISNSFFSYNPACFGLVINNFYFLNASYSYLFSRRLGLPYPKSQSLLGNGKFSLVKMDGGLKRVIYPLIRKEYKRICTEVYQPIITKGVKEDRTSKEFYEGNEYLTEFFEDEFELLGKVLYAKNGKIEKYPQSGSMEWFPDEILDRSFIEKEFAREVILFQDYIIKGFPTLELLDKKQRKFWKAGIADMKKWNKKLLEWIQNREIF